MTETKYIIKDSLFVMASYYHIVSAPQPCHIPLQYEIIPGPAGVNIRCKGRSRGLLVAEQTTILIAIDYGCI